MDTLIFGLLLATAWVIVRGGSRRTVLGNVAFGWLSKLTLGLFLFLIAANLVAVFVEEGFHWYLPDNPTKYELVQ